MPCLLCYETSSPLQKLRRYGFHVSRYGARVHEYILRISVMAGWIAEMPMLCNGQNIADYEVYWLMGFPIINLWGARFTSVFSVFSVMAGWIAEILFMLV